MDNSESLNRIKKNAGKSSDDVTEKFKSVATRVSVVSILGNAALSIFKFLAGIFAHSGAMISDAVHSASDVVSSIIVIIGVRISGREPDKDHPYGHERFECVAALLLSMLLAVVGAKIGISAIDTIRNADAEAIAVPGTLALIAAIVSIVAKEAMFWYTITAARKIRSAALKADAWHHRSDALSSIGALIGIGGAMLGAPILEPIASIVICLFIFKVAIDIFRNAIDQMVDHRCDDETEEALRDCALAEEGVLGVDMLNTRMFGARVYVDIEIRVDGELKLTDAHEIAERVHDAVEERFPEVKHVMVHVNPA